jgi:hypothetical protein
VACSRYIEFSRLSDVPMERSKSIAPDTSQSSMGHSHVVIASASSTPAGLFERGRCSRAPVSCSHFSPISTAKNVWITLKNDCLYSENMSNIQLKTLHKRDVSFLWNCALNILSSKTSTVVAVWSSSNGESWFFFSSVVDVEIS